MAGFLAAAACASALVQGGYFPAFFLLAGGALSVGLAVCRRQLRCSLPLALLGALALWYLLASLVSGPSAKGLAQASLPLVCSLYGLLWSGLTEPERRNWKVWMGRAGGVIAILAILSFVGVLPIPGAVTAHRLQFTFQYVNAAGVWLAAVLFLDLETGDKWSLRLAPVVLLALALTRSAGAIGAFLLLLLLTLLCRFGWKSWRTWAMGGGALAAAIAVLATRGQQVLATFQERLVQSADGLRAILASPVFGWGAGNWRVVKDRFQSYDYRAQVVHNSYVQSGVEAGAVALVLLAAAVLLALWALGREKPAVLAGACLIPLHALLDISFCFLSADVLCLSLLAGPAGQGREVPRRVSAALGCVCFVFFILLAVLSRMG